MYKIEFYENQHGESEVWDFLEALRVKSKSSKDARIQYNQILFYIDLLAKKRHQSAGQYHQTSGRRHLGTASRKQPGLLFLL